MIQLNLDVAVLSLALCFAFSLISGIFYQTTKKTSKYPSGPPTWPIIGNLTYFLQLLKNPELELLKLPQKYGALCMLWFGNSPVLIINTAEEVKALLDKVCYQSNHSCRSFFRPN